MCLLDKRRFACALAVVWLEPNRLRVVPIEADHSILNGSCGVRPTGKIARVDDRGLVEFPRWSERWR